jgi:hypothetical protein
MAFGHLGALGKGIGKQGGGTGSRPAISLSGLVFPPNSIAGTVIGNLSVRGGTGTYTYSFISNPGSLFQIVGSQLQVLNATIAAGSYPVTIQASGGVPTPVVGIFTLFAAIAPTNATTPVVSGSTPVGSVLTTTNGTWNNSPTSFGYQWQRAGVNISGANASTYTSVTADVGLAVRCVVTAINAAGSASANSNAITVTPPTPVNTIAPAITGSPVVGNVLTTDNGTWSNSPTGYTYQWQKGGVNISGAITSSYTSVAGDIGGIITCVVTASNAAGSASASSNSITVTGSLSGQPMGILMGVTYP